MNEKRKKYTQGRYPSSAKSNPSNCQIQKKREGGGEQDECTSSRNNHPTIQKHIERGGARRGKTKVTIRKKKHVPPPSAYREGSFGVGISSRHSFNLATTRFWAHTPSNPHARTCTRVRERQGSKVQGPKSPNPTSLVTF